MNPCSIDNECVYGCYHTKGPTSFYWFCRWNTLKKTYVQNENCNNVCINGLCSTAWTRSGAPNNETNLYVLLDLPAFHTELGSAIAKLKPHHQQIRKEHQV